MFRSAFPLLAIVGLTDAAGKYGLIIDIALNPAHELLNVGWSRHFGRSFEVLVVLPKVFESV
jgi:hypothetical protein